MIVIALLRGINVGGNNIIKMAELRSALEAAGFENVKTYIQSGNIIFESKEDLDDIKSNLAKLLKSNFDYEGQIMLITKSDLENVVKNAPKNFGENSDKYKYDVMFLNNNLNSKDVVKQIETHDEVDEVFAGKNVVYFARLISKLTKSYMPKITQSKFYKDLTIRNWRTTNKILELANE